MKKPLNRYYNMMDVAEVYWITIGMFLILLNGDFGMAYGRAQRAEPLAEAPTPCEARVQVSRMRQVPL